MYINVVVKLSTKSYNTEMLHYGAIDYHILQVAENTRFQIK